MASDKAATRREVLVTLGALVWAACDDKTTGAANSAADGAGKPDAGALATDGASADMTTATPADAGTGAEVATAAPDAAKDALAAAVNPKPKPISPITSNETHYITSCCPLEVVDGKAWQLSIQDHGKEIAVFTLAELEALKTKTKEHTLECIGTGPYGQAISNAIWTGLPLQELLTTRGLQVPTSNFLKFTALDNFTTALPWSDLTKPLWLVWRMNGQPLPHDHGFPARMLIPDRYGMKNPKWVKIIDFIEEDYQGFWEKGGWSNSANYLPNTFFREPRGDVPLHAGAMQAVGTAYCGSDPVVAVDYRIDKGPWLPAQIDYGPGPDIWVLWHFDAVLTKGAHKLQARCTTKSGKQSSDDPNGTDPTSGAGYDGSMEVEIAVLG